MIERSVTYEDFRFITLPILYLVFFGRPPPPPTHTQRVLKAVFLNSIHRLPQSNDIDTLYFGLGALWNLYTLGRGRVLLLA